ncbi:putative acyltransferase [Ceratocystis lukuohia]|uniref:Acyltransferase n=2 Tax=Ceratocystis TaxID=5157 RepID=A0ABR4MS47_9PEZI|nr:putative acyltransferase [Ceratocystis platani]
MNALLKGAAMDVHPGGKVKHGPLMQVARGVVLALYFLVGCLAILATQVLGSPLYWINRPLYYSYIALTKQSFALLAITVTQWWGPTTIRISGDDSVANQMRRTQDGRVEFDFPERLVLIANHQIYTDWLYLWWVGYANKLQMHGHIYIILKESLKMVPILGQGMQLYRFIFMSRKMSIDQPRLAYRLDKLKERHVAPNGTEYMNPMWLLLFPEGTNISPNSRPRSQKWADKMGIKNPEHVLLPRSTGTYFCLKQLDHSVEYLYDCTVAYEGIPRGGYGEDYFTLQSTYFQGRPPKSVNFHWRRFRIADIPLDTCEEFDRWLRERWYEKDALMETYLATGRFPTSDLAKKDYIETAVRTKYPFEFIEVYNVLGGILGVTHFARRMVRALLR